MKIPWQTSIWTGDIGKSYTDRNSHCLDAWEQMYIDKFGITRTEMNSMFLGNLDRGIKILEVGCNLGNQLLILQRMGFENLYGIEIQPYAVELARKRTERINIIRGNAFDIPFKDGFFDLVFTSGVLIHFPMIDLELIMDEIYRCSNKYIWGYEYYNQDFKEIMWRGIANMMWKTDYAKLYMEQFKLSLVREEHFKYLTEDNEDTMFLLSK